jgi:hypothetical protein
VIEFTDTPLNGVEAKLVGTDLAVYQMTVPDALEALASMLADVGFSVWEEHLHESDEPSKEEDVLEAATEVVVSDEASVEAIEESGNPQLAEPGGE